MHLLSTNALSHFDRIDLSLLAFKFMIIEASSRYIPKLINFLRVKKIFIR